MSSADVLAAPQSPPSLGSKLREVGGRSLNTLNDMYMLPADAPEHARLGLQHEALYLAVGALYHDKENVARALAPHADRRPAVIDLGTGSGTWALAMAEAFPHCDIVGVDLAPVGVTDINAVPSNCRFECRDVAQGFPEYHGKFDVVHSRCMTAGIKDMGKFVQEACRLLRPGGELLIVDGDLQLVSETFTPLPMVCEPGSFGFSWLQKAFTAASQAMLARGADIHAVSTLPQLLESMPDLEGVGSKTEYIPVGAWVKGDAKVEKMGALMEQDASIVIHGMKPLLLAGLENVDEVLSKAEAELAAIEVKSYSQWHYVWCRKRA